MVIGVELYCPHSLRASCAHLCGARWRQGRRKVPPASTCAVWDASARGAHTESSLGLAARDPHGRQGVSASAARAQTVLAPAFVRPAANTQRRHPRPRPEGGRDAVEIALYETVDQAGVSSAVYSVLARDTHKVGPPRIQLRWLETTAAGICRISRCACVWPRRERALLGCSASHQRAHRQTGRSRQLCCAPPRKESARVTSPALVASHTLCGLICVHSAC